MEKPDKRIVEFIKDHHVLTLATSKNNIPYCSNCFYAYIEELNSFVFTSDSNTRHIEEATQQPLVAGSIVLETSIVGKIQGIQFSGKMFEPEGENKKIANMAYLKRFPFAILMKTTIWILEVSFLKMTDNRLGFGKKLLWENEKGNFENK